MLGIMQTVSLVWIVTVMITPVSDSYVIPAFMLLVAATWSDSGVIAKALSGKLPEKLGEISYSVYITHVFLISMINFIWERTGRRFISDPTLERSLFLVLCFAIVIFVSTILYARVERPVRAYLSKRWIPRGSPRRAVASA
jgi:peptidoglycan/LPS O-acetylase OafA/YrhL